MSHTPLVSLSIPRNAITCGIPVSDNDTTWDLSQRTGLIGELTPRDNIPRAGKIR